MEFWEDFFIFLLIDFIFLLHLIYKKYCSSYCQALNIVYAVDTYSIICDCLYSCHQNHDTLYTLLLCFAVLEPPRDNGGAEITNYILQIGDGCSKFTFIVCACACL